MLAFDTREQFLNSRRGKIGASDAAVIMGESPYSTPYKLWRLKLGVDEKAKMLPHMQAGLDIEDEARDWFYQTTGIQVFPYQIQHPTIPYMIASLDGISLDKTTILEIKRPSLKDHEIAKNTGKPPKKYWIQIQHQLECTHLDFEYYLSFYKDDPILLTVKRDHDYIKTLLGREAEFFNCMTQIIEPDLIDADFEKRDDDDWNFTSCEVKEYKDKIKELEKKLQVSENRLFFLSNGKNCEGNGVRIRQIVRKGNIDYLAIPQLKDLDLEQYRKEPSKYWKINIGK
jgi:putative phage-type endonuclease